MFSDRWKKIIRYTHYPFHISENLECVGRRNKNNKLEEEVEQCVALSFKLKYFQLGERKDIETQKTNEMQKAQETPKS